MRIFINGDQHDVEPRTLALALEELGYRGKKIATAVNGRFVAFESNSTNLVRGHTNGQDQIFVHDRRTGKTSLVSVNSAGVQAKGKDSSAPSISANGRFVAFQSQAPNLARGRDTNHTIDIFVHDRKTGKTKRVSVSSAGAQADDESRAPSISAHGRSGQWLER